MLKNVIKYDVKYSCDIISPTKGENITIKVDNINKMGIIGYIEIDEKYAKSEKPFENSPLLIMIPNDQVNSYNIGDNCILSIVKDGFYFIYPGAHKIFI